MADTTQTLLSVTLTKNQKLSELPISNDSQMIFVEDLHTIALDYHGQRTFYNQIQTIETEQDRQNLTPVNGVFYFVLDSVVLYGYHDEWIPLTQTSSNTIYIGISKPTVGFENTLYVDKLQKNISIWDDESNDYIIVGEQANSNNACISNDEISKLFE